MSSGHGKQREPAVPRRRRASRPPAPLLIRGEYDDPAVDRVQCEAFFTRFRDWGRYGLSAYAAHTDDEVQRLAADQLERFAVLSLFGTTTLESAGFEIVPTFRSPHMTIAFTGNLDVRLAQLAELRIDLRPNPHHER